MRKLTDYLLWPNAWVGVLSVLAVVGLLLCGVGFLANVRQLTLIGLWLTAPLQIGGIIILFVVIPVLIVANRKQRKQDGS